MSAGTGPVWPENILPSLTRQAAAAQASELLSLNPRILEGLRELAKSNGRARQLVSLCETWKTLDGAATVPVGEVRNILGPQEG